ncbi:hypothetical protein CTI12_AA104570 [Artemisia annua]|uniref:ACT domain-containing protein n=1 Tax=Artemisia annua TaxID=35608 RepID=A0A2U1M5F3_ARTAN|nr:hypothetical protein CTI12_AA418330 [Artemisia annua]PWA82357.1 hypothetical protein CTI12_AA104570 [Artemisia annua]
MEGSWETVLDCVVPYIHDGDDLNSISLVSRKFYDLDCRTRKHVTVHLFYALSPSSLSKRFPFIESLTLKGLPYSDFPQVSGIDITPWIEEIADKFKSLKALHIRGLVVGDEDLELLARTRGKDLRSLRIHGCQGFSTDGIMHISKYCNDLRTLCFERCCKGNMAWLYELALCNTRIETLHFQLNIDDGVDASEAVTLLAKSCSESLVSLKVSGCYLDELKDAFSHAHKLEYFDGAWIDENCDDSSFSFPTTIRGLGIKDLPETSFRFLLPCLNQLRVLKLEEVQNCQCFFFKRCPNLEVLHTGDVCGDKGLRVIGQICKKLRKLHHFGDVTHKGLIAMAQGCPNLESLNVSLKDISNKALERVGTHLKNLHDFSMYMVDEKGITDSPLDNGILAMLKGCIKLKWLDLNLGEGGLTDVGLGYIGNYGHNLRCLFLNGCTGESDAGLLELSRGCPKLRKLCLNDCPFSKQAVATFLFNIQSLRYIWSEKGYDLTLTRPLIPPTFTAEVLTELNQYVTLAEKLHKLAVQFIADGSGLGSVKITFTSSRATDNFNTPLVRAMVAKGIYVNEEQVIVDGSADKPLEIIKVQIANVESRLAVAISESGEIKVEGRVKDGVPHLTKVGALDVDVSLEGNIILCSQADQPNIIVRVGSILDKENVTISSISFGRIAQRKQAVMVIGVDHKPSKKALKKIDEIPAIEEFVFLAL